MSYPNNGYNQSSGQSDNSPRRPNIATESRVLNIIHKQHQQHRSEQLDQSSLQQSRPTNNEASPSTNQQAPPPPLPPPQQQQQLSQQLTLPEMPSQLSVNAKEFVPRAQNVSAGFAEDALGLSASAAEFVPRAPDGSYAFYDNESYSNNLEGYRGDYMSNQLLNSFGNMQVQDNYSQQHQPQPQDVSGAGSGSNAIVDRFNGALYMLNMNPGNMKDYLKPICDLIESSSPQDSQTTMNAMVEGLFEQSIQEPNFRYTGARICQFLNCNLKGNAHFSGFYKTFMRRCQQEYAKREELISGTPGDRNRLMGLSMFMAEIFLNVEIEQPDGTVSRIQFLPRTLIDLVHTLLSHPMELEVKSCCQLLKLSGALIEDVAKTSPELCEQFEDIFIQLGSLKTRTELPNNTRVLVGSVIQLKEQNWNRTNFSPPKKPVFSFASDQTSFQQEGPVFYTQNGDICSGTDAGFPEDENSYVLNEEEEAAFLEWQAEQEGLTSDQTRGPFDDTGYDSYSLEEIPDEGGMGEELEAAFEEFLQEQTSSLSSSSTHQHHPQPHHQQQHHHQQPRQHHQQHNYHQGFAPGAGGMGFPGQGGFPQTHQHHRQQHQQQPMSLPQHMQSAYPPMYQPQLPQMQPEYYGNYQHHPGQGMMGHRQDMNHPTGGAGGPDFHQEGPPLPPSQGRPYHPSQNHQQPPLNDQFHYNRR